LQALLQKKKPCLPIQENVILSNAKELVTATSSFALLRMTTLLSGRSGRNAHRGRLYIGVGARYAPYRWRRYTKGEVIAITSPGSMRQEGQSQALARAFRRFHLERLAKWRSTDARG
jgi:hypothetical protein